MRLPGHIFDALLDACDHLETRALNDAILASSFPGLCSSAYRERNPDYEAMEALDRLDERFERDLRGRSENEIAWGQLQMLKQMPGIKVNPRKGVGNG